MYSVTDLQRFALLHDSVRSAVIKGDSLVVTDIEGYTEVCYTMKKLKQWLGY